MDTKKLHIQSKAKVNLFLDIVSKRDDGYHSLNTVYQLIDLSDSLEFDVIKNGIEIISENLIVPSDQSNIVFKSVQILSEYAGLKDIGIKVKINKKIPIGAGLGGGSSNAAATIVALNKLFQLNLEFDDLLNIAQRIGMDVPFHLFGGRCIGTNRGEIIEPITNDIIYLVLVNTELEISTKWAYQQIELETVIKHPSLTNFIKVLSDSSINGIGKKLYNTFEQFIFPRYPILDEIKKELLNEGAYGALMSGSGSTIFGIFESKSQAETVRDKLKEKYKYVFATTSGSSYSWSPKTN